MQHRVDTAMISGKGLIYGDQRIHLHADEIGYHGVEGPN